MSNKLGSRFSFDSRFFSFTRSWWVCRKSTFVVRDSLSVARGPSTRPGALHQCVNPKYPLTSQKVQEPGGLLWTMLMLGCQQVFPPWKLMTTCHLKDLWVLGSPRSSSSAGIQMLEPRYRPSLILCHLRKLALWPEHPCLLLSRPPGTFPLSYYLAANVY